MALAVEAEANSTVKTNSEKMIRYVGTCLASTGCKTFMQIAGENARHSSANPDLGKGSVGFATRETGIAGRFGCCEVGEETFADGAGNGVRRKEAYG